MLWRVGGGVTVPITIIRGPAGGGKSQLLAERQRPGDVLNDFTRIYVALAGVERGPDGRYPERADGDPLLPLAAAIKTTAVREASARELSGYVTTSDGRAEEVERLRRAGRRWIGTAGAVGAAGRRSVWKSTIGRR